MKKHVLATLLLGALGGCGDGAETSTNSGKTVAYACENGEQITVAYQNPANGQATARLTRGDTVIPLNIAVSGSGERYVGTDQLSAIEWHTKGKMGLLSSVEGSTEVTLECQEPR